MAKTRALVKRRKAIRNIRKITRTMELIATARFRKALDRATQAEAFTSKITELAADLSRTGANVRHPLLEVRTEVRKALVLVITSNRGLCGGYNAGILREATALLRKLQAEGVAVRLEAAGKRGISFFRFQGIPVDQAYTHFEDKPSFEEVDVLAAKYIDLYVRGEVDQVTVVYQKFYNASRQTPVAETLLPLAAVAPGPARPAAAQAETAAGAKVPTEYEFLPGPQEILEEILPVSFKVRLFKCFLDAAVSEQIARRVAMKAATDNAGDMIRNITRQYNRARQAQITTEIAEVIGGAEALK